MDYYGDYHTHTRRSDGRQSEEQIIAAAMEWGLKEVAITDHGPMAAGIGIKNPQAYLELKERIENLQPLYPDITILTGAEANIRDLDGTLDIPPDILEQLDIVIAGLHPYTLPTSLQDGVDIFVQNSLRHFSKAQREKAVNANTKATVEAIYANPQIDILSHPGLYFTVDVEEVARACVKQEVLFEINCGHKHPHVSDIIIAEREGVDFIINSDAHFTDTVGDLRYGSEVVAELKIDPDRIVNCLDGGGHTRWAKKHKAYTF
ncbi:MAG TPA: PHP domain-containing protein [Syntrophomonadaceae bacterium]|jgi:putative hydrolase|nr:PHP domain-containing protein [Syntrophomonadaceae bacterium]